MIEVPARVRRTFALPGTAASAFALLSDVPAWGALFPHVAGIEPLAPGVWRWEMEPLGPPGAQAQTVYACRYAFDADALEVAWTPEPGVGNARFEGGVTLAPEASGATEAELWLAATLEIPAPWFTAALVRPAVALEFGRMTDRFIARLATALGGA